MSAAAKRCSACRRELPVARFNRHPHTRDGLQSQCKDCNRATVAASRAAGRTNDRAQRAAQYAAEVELRRRHRDEFDALYNAERVARGLRPARSASVALAASEPSPSPPPGSGAANGAASPVAVAPGPPVLPVRAAAAPCPGDAAETVPVH